MVHDIGGAVYAEDAEGADLHAGPYFTRQGMGVFGKGRQVGEVGAVERCRGGLRGEERCMCGEDQVDREQFYNDWVSSLHRLVYSNKYNGFAIRTTTYVVPRTKPLPIIVIFLFSKWWKISLRIFFTVTLCPRGSVNPIPPASSM